MVITWNRTNLYNMLTFMFSDEKKGRLLTPLNEDQAAAVTAGAVGLGIGVLGSLVVGKLVEVVLAGRCQGHIRAVRHAVGDSDQGPI